MDATILRKLIQEHIDRGLSRREIARRSKVPLASINNYLDTDMQPTIKTLERFSAYFRKPITYFMDGQDRGTTAPPTAAPDTLGLLMHTVRMQGMMIEELQHKCRSILEGELVAQVKALEDDLAEIKNRLTEERRKKAINTNG